MSGLVEAVVIAAVLVLVLLRQFAPQRVASDVRRWWVLPAVLVFMAVRKPGLVDHAHEAVSVALLAAGVLAGLATGAGWAWTTRVWSDASGALWAQGGKASALVWAGGVVLRLALHAVGAAAGVHQGGSATMLTAAAMLLARSGLVVWKAQGVRPAYRVPAGE
ncbi:DUF1453 domain-containing protein [Streptomyces sp. NPDC050617]|uniref:DUF1453 domain-containing protein n=1 Tax=Streptomyces sp. NPDC050617 TaxID=3154628 RepID=UPI00341E8A2B